MKLSVQARCFKLEQSLLGTLPRLKFLKDDREKERKAREVDEREFFSRALGKKK